MRTSGMTVTKIVDGVTVSEVLPITVELDFVATTLKGLAEKFAAQFNIDEKEAFAFMVQDFMISLPVLKKDKFLELAYNAFNNYK
jgi:hypothetical protein